MTEVPAMNEHPLDQGLYQDTVQPSTESWLSRVDSAARSGKIYYPATATNIALAIGAISMSAFGLPNAVMTGNLHAIGADLLCAFGGSFVLWRDGTEGLERALRGMSAVSRSVIPHLDRAADALSSKADQVKTLLGR